MLVFSRIHFALVALLLVACAPLHVPQPPQTALLAGPGDGHVRIQGGAQGHQLDLAYAPVDHVGVRGAAHGDILFSRHAMLTGGVGAFAHPGAARLGVWMDGGVGFGSGVVTTDIDLFTDTPPSTHRLEARLHQLSGTVEGGWDLDRVELGLAVRGNRLWADHTPASDESGVSVLTTVEPVFNTRVGGGPLGFTAHTGVMVPVDFRGDVGVPFPILVGAGLEYDFGGV